MRTRLGCLTIPAIISIVVGLVVFGMITWVGGGALFSPGGLNAQAGAQPVGGVLSHADLSANCSACHPAPWQVETISDKCMGCHTDVGQDPVNFHHKLVDESVGCRDCHVDHRGATASLTVLQSNQFPHEKVGYSLSGHRKTANGSLFTCSDCHGEKTSTFDEGVCATCHNEIDTIFLQAHSSAFGMDCLGCHNGPDELGMGKLNHNQFIYQVTGKHTTIECEACHAGAVKSVDFQLAPQDCSGCHGKDDPHLGRLGQGCAACHSPEDWTITNFDHSNYAFQLIGKHASVACIDCHLDANLGNTPQTCAACHNKQDPHEGQLGQDCASCHSTDDWQKVHFDHSTAVFPLLGRHFGVACQECHQTSLFKDTPQDCYDCHSSQDPHQGQLGQTCVKCHTPVDWKVINFDHSNAPFKLIGKHISVGCQDCHQDLLYKSTPQDCYSCHNKDDAHQGQLGQNCVSCHTPDDWTSVNFDHSSATFKLTGGHTTVACSDCHKDFLYKNTPQDCYNCHVKDDNHQGQFGKDCGSCHTTAGWSQVTFNHANTAFPLMGKHISVNCLSCHINGQFKGTAKDCYACHAKDDNHNGQLGTSCVNCHSPAGWSQVTFDHSKSSFPLVGTHSGVNCSACHINGKYKGTPKDCYSCHAKDDNHNGQLGTDCGLCHSPSGWSSVTFDHSSSSFPLTGKHANVNCTACHVNGQFKGTPKDCYSCHAKDDNHNGQLGADCAACHSPVGWSPATFDHSKSSFPLTGKHVGVNCASCHPNGRYKGTPTDCNSCHAQDDTHNGQFGTNCATCHNTNGWGGANFDHSQTGFPLVGQHVSVACTSCHANGQYKGTPKDCYSCHAGNDAHHGQYGTNCATCHDPSGWKPAHFNHSGFPLTGAHANLPCTSCHPGGRFQGTPTACSACHSEPDYHAGLFGTECSQCHNTGSWSPAQFNSSHTFPTNHGGNNTCHTCHPQKLAQYTCYSCHDQNEIRNKHIEKGIPNFDNCIQCHPTGRTGGLHQNDQQYVVLFDWLDRLWGVNW